MSAQRRFFSGNSVDQALVQAAAHYGCPADDLAWSEVEKRHGFLKARRKVVIQIDPASPFRSKGAAGTETPPAAFEPRPAEPSVAEAAPEPAVTEPTVSEPAVTQPAPEPEPPAAEPPAFEPRFAPAPAREEPRLDPAPPEPQSQPQAEADPQPSDPAPSAPQGVEHPATETPATPSWLRPAVPDEPSTSEPPQVGDSTESAAGSADAQPASGAEEQAPSRRRRRRRGGRGRGRSRGERDGAASTSSDGGGDFIEVPHQLRSSAERYTPATGELAEAALGATRDLLAFARLDLDVAVFDSDDGLLIELSGASEDEVLEDRGRPMFAIQHLVPRLLYGMIGRSSRVTVDCDNFQEVRREMLRDEALRAASSVMQGGRPMQLEPMAPDERRIVHLALSDDPNVTTQSEGEGYFKRVRVLPAGGGRGGRGPSGSGGRSRGRDYRR